MPTPKMVNPEMVVLARESRVLSQKELAQALNVSQGELSKIESGLRLPSHELLEKLSTVLNYPQKFFLLTETIKGPTSNCAYYRKRQSTPLYIIRRVLAVANVWRIRVQRLLVAGMAEIDTPLKFLKLELEDYRGGPAQIASVVRLLWSLPPGPVQNVIGSIEDAGGIVVKFDFGTRKIDALSQWFQDYPPIFFVNSSIPTDRMRYSLAHELGHTVMHQMPTDDVEREADAFAAEFLMPVSQIAPHLQELSLPKLAALKPYWRVSMNAMLKRACDLESISPRQRSYLWTQMGMSGYRSHEPITIPPEKPGLLAGC
jgi:Zn-dependent peptidase ImmA (M78 family)/transcriptional regulator with XRE-family HTH domain